MAKKKKPVLVSMNGKPLEKTYRTGGKNGKPIISFLDRLAQKTMGKKKKRGQNETVASVTGRIGRDSS